MLPVPNLDEYLDPLLYDLENPDDEDVCNFYRSLAERLGNPILELGCGTGRFSIPLARAGFDVTALDIVPGMVERGKAKAGDLPIRWVVGDARSFSLARKYRLVFEGGSVFMHLLTRADQLACLARVREHLAPGGQFAFGLFFPHPALQATDLEEKEWFNYQDDARGWTIRVSGVESYDEIAQVKTETAIRRITDQSGAEVTRRAPLALRYTFPQEAELLLSHAGFRVVGRFGGPDSSPLTASSQFLVYLCEKEEKDPR